MKIKTKMLGTIVYRNCLFYYDYPRLFICTNRFGLFHKKFYIFQEWESEKDHITWGVCDLKKWNISKKDFLLKDTKERYAELPNEKCYLLNTLIYDYQIRFNTNDKTIIEKEISPRKWIDGKFIYLKEKKKDEHKI